MIFASGSPVTQDTTTTVLITGASGFVGRQLCAEAMQRGLHVIGASRGAGNMPSCVRSVAVGEINGETNWEPALVGVDVVVHLAARVHVMKDVAVDPLAEFLKVNQQGTERLARQAARAGVKRLVYVSSIKVHGENSRNNCCGHDGGGRFVESDTPHPLDPYGMSKWQAEQSLHRIAGETGLEIVIIRPPLVYGPEVKGNIAHMLGVLSKRIPLPFASVNNRRSLLYVGNLADAIITCMSHPDAAGQTYLLSDGEDVSTPELLRELAAGMGVPVYLFPCPPKLLWLAGKLTGRTQQLERLLGSLQVDSDKIRNDLNWVPPYSLRHGLRATAEWYRTKHT